MIWKYWKGNLIIVFTFLLACMLNVLPLPTWANFFRPDWTILVLFYWVIAVPHRINLGIAWLLGLLTDTLTSSVLGEHALAMTILAYVAVKIHKQLRVLPLWQQALFLVPLFFAYQLLIVMINTMLGMSGAGWWFFLPTLTSALLWPWLFILLRDCRRRFNIV